MFVPKEAPNTAKQSQISAKESTFAVKKQTMETASMGLA